VALLLWKFWLVSPGISTSVYTPYKQHHPVRFICDFLFAGICKSDAIGWLAVTLPTAQLP
jgi:hypothetical protein